VRAIGETPLSETAKKTDDNFTSHQVHDDTEARISPNGEQLALGAIPDGRQESPKASKGRSDVKRGHKRRGPRSMGRHPFMTAVNRLISEEESQRCYTGSTPDERRRKMKLVARIVQGCYDRGEIGTTNPAKLTVTECGVIIGAINGGYCEGPPKPSKGRRDPATSSKMTKFFETILEYHENAAVSRLRLTKKVLFPHVSSNGDIEVVRYGAWQTLVAGEWHLSDPWWDTVAHAAVRLYSTTGLRVSEARRQRADGIDLINGVIAVTHPKGEGKWARSGDLRGLVPQASALLRDYLEVREDELTSRGLDPSTVQWLFPFFSDDGLPTEWQERIWHGMMAEVREKTGVKFNFRMLRPTFCQKAIDDGTDPNDVHGQEISASNVSRQMGHMSTLTTERYYGRIRKDNAFARVSKTWKPLWDNVSIQVD